MSINVNVYLHGMDDEDRIAKILHRVEELKISQRNIMATIDDLVSVVDEVLGEVGKLGPAVDTLEAKITEALKNAGLSPQAQAKIDEAVGKLKGVVANVATAIADATDGIDEASLPPPTPPAPPVEEPPVV